MIREDCLGRETRQAMESALSVMRDKIDNALHREDQRAACDYSLVQIVDTVLITIFNSFQMCALFEYLYTVFCGYCCPLGNYKIA